MTNENRPEAMKLWRTLEVEDTELEVLDWGSGEPIVFVQTALTADELLPLAEEPILEQGYRKILYHRRGYAGSGPSNRPGSITRDAADCRALLTTMGVERVHIVGLSYSGAVALQLAADAPAFAQSLTLLEPPPVHTPSAPEFRAANDRLIRSRQERGPAAALDEFLTILVGPEWRQVAEGYLPGSATQMERDMVTVLRFRPPGPAGLAIRASRRAPYQLPRAAYRWQRERPVVRRGPSTHPGLVTPRRGCGD